MSALRESSRKTLVAGLRGSHRRWSRSLFIVGAAALLLSSLACRNITIETGSGDDYYRISAPMALLRAAISFSGEEQTLVIDDLGGVDLDLDLRELAAGLRQHAVSSATKTKAATWIELDSGDQTMLARGFSDRLELQISESYGDEDDEQKVRLCLPWALIDACLDQPDGKISADDVYRSLRGYRGVLLEVDDPYDPVRISIR
jgi:hypothetical protein